MNTVTPDSVGLSASRLSHIHTAMQSYVEQGKLPGAITILARRGEIAHAECFGMMDIESGKPMRLDTLFPIFSMTKPVTSVAVMMLYEEGHFQLLDPISKFLPEFKGGQVYVKTTETGIELTNREREITIRDLLTHTSGLMSDFWADPAFTQLYQEVGVYQPDITLQEFAQKIAKLPALNQPGMAWRYGESFEVLARLVEVVSGMPYASFLKKNIFEPLSMVDTGFFGSKEREERFAKYYGFSKTGGLVEAVEPPRLMPSSFPRGGFGLVSTATDFLRFAQMLLNGGELDGKRLLS